MRRLIARLPTAADFHRCRGALAGLAFGAGLQLVLLGLVTAAHTGGLSDAGQPPRAVDWLAAD